MEKPPLRDPPPPLSEMAMAEVAEEFCPLRLFVVVVGVLVLLRSRATGSVLVAVEIDAIE